MSGLERVRRLAICVAALGLCLSLISARETPRRSEALEVSAGADGPLLAAEPERPREESRAPACQPSLTVVNSYYPEDEGDPDWPVFIPVPPPLGRRRDKKRKNDDAREREGWR